MLNKHDKLCQPYVSLSYEFYFLIPIPYAVYHAFFDNLDNLRYIISIQIMSVLKKIQLLELETLLTRSAVIDYIYFRLGMAPCTINKFI